MTDSSYYIAIAGAIRTKNGTNDKYYPGDMAAAILNLSSGGSGEGGTGTSTNQKVYYTVSIPSLTNQSFLVSIDGVGQTSGTTVTAEKGSIMTYTTPVADTGFTAGTVTVTGGTRCYDSRTYCVTSNITISVSDATYSSGGGGDAGGSSDEDFNIEDLRPDENLYMSDIIYTCLKEGASDWNTRVSSGNINSIVGEGNTVNIEYCVFVPTGAGGGYGPELVIKSEGESNQNISVTNTSSILNTNNHVYGNGTLYWAVVQYTVNSTSVTTFPFFKQYGEYSGGDIKIRLRASDKTQLMTPDVVAGGLYSN